MTDISGNEETRLRDPSKKIGPMQPHNSPVYSYGSSVTVRTVRGMDGVSISY